MLAPPPIQLCLRLVLGYANDQRTSGLERSISKDEIGTYFAISVASFANDETPQLANGSECGKHTASTWMLMGP